MFPLGEFIIADLICGIIVNGDAATVVLCKQYNKLTEFVGINLNEQTFISL